MILVLFSTSLLFCACGGGVEAGEKPSEQLRAVLENWTNGFNARNVDTVCDIFAPDLVAVFQGQPDRGFDQLCQGLRNSLNDPTRKFHYELDIKDVFVSGSLGAVRLVWTLTITKPDGSPIGTSVEPGIDIFERQPDGKWRIARYVSFSLNP